MCSEAEAMKTYGAHEVQLRTFLTSTQQRGQLNFWRLMSTIVVVPHR